MFSVTTTTDAQTQTIGKKMANLVTAGDVILLDGDLGAGKTTFTKGLAAGLGISRYVKSPTFTIIREYKEGRIPLYHMDVYRLENGGGDELGLDEYFNGQGVSVVEWSQFVTGELPAERLTIHLHRDEQNIDRRVLTFDPQGERYQLMVKKLEAQVNE